MLLVILAFYWNSSVALDDATRADLARVGYTEGHFAAARAEGGWRSFDLTRLSEMSLLRHRMRQSKGEIPLDAAGPVSARTGALAEEVQTRYGRIPLPEWLGGDLMLTFRMLLFLGLFIGFAIKVPIFPFHTWLPDAHVEAPTAISVILAGVLLKMGTYGILRISYPLLPAEAVLFCGPLALLAVVNMLYGAFCAMAQTDLKKLVAYSSISHMGYVCLGMAVLTRTGLNGGVLQMFNHGTITAMLFLLVGVIYDRAHHRDINGFGGLGLRVPIYTGITAIAFFASLGLPGLSGFWGEAFVFLGTWEVPAFRGYALAGVFGIIVTAAYLLWTLQRVFMGKLNEKYATLEEISAREMATLLPLLVVVIVVGVYPNPVLSLIQASLNDMSDVFLWLRSQGGV
ncbi:MAG: NADH-quinone oxidoreductase subunit M [Planctomycetes bacterium]|nr:NADH-quinone oxidoreductase subunit M [Planctomycetota bacterium]